MLASLATVFFAVPSCMTSLDCGLNGDCVSGSCVCDHAWAGNEDCTAMAFEPLNRTAMPGYYNLTESSWGGLPIEDGSGGFKLVHAQMANGCDLGTWTTNSIVALSTSTSGNVEGPYTFERELLPPFAHNPTVRRAPDGTYLIYFIGGWETLAQSCGGWQRGAGGTGRAASWSASGATGATAVPTQCDGHTWPKACGPAMPGPMNDTCGPAKAPYSGNAGCGISIASGETRDTHPNIHHHPAAVQLHLGSACPLLNGLQSYTRTAPTLNGPWSVRPLKIVDQWLSTEVCTEVCYMSNTTRVSS